MLPSCLFLRRAPRHCGGPTSCSRVLCNFCNKKLWVFILLFLKSVFVVFSFDHCSATMSNLNVCSCCHAVSTPFTIQNVLALVLKHVACLDMFVPQRVLPFSMSCLSFHSWQLLTVGQFHESANCFSHGS